MALEVKGKIHKIFDAAQKTETFKTREFVIETEENYPQLVKFQLTQDKCNLIDAYEEGEQINVFFNLRGREWQGKFFTNLDAWKIEKANSQSSNIETSSTDNEAAPAPPPTQANQSPLDSNEESDDLPF